MIHQYTLSSTHRWPLGGTFYDGLRITWVRKDVVEGIPLPAWVTFSTNMPAYSQMTFYDTPPTSPSKPPEHSYGKTTLKTYMRAVQSILGGNGGH